MLGNLRLHKQLRLKFDVKKLSFFANNIDITKATVHYPITFTSCILIHILFCMCTPSQTKACLIIWEYGGKRKQLKKLGFWSQEALNLLRELNVNKFS